MHALEVAACLMHAYRGGSRRLIDSGLSTASCRALMRQACPLRAVGWCRWAETLERT